MAVDIVVQHWLSLTVEDDSAIRNGIGMAAGRIMVVFYADGGIIGSREPEWIQGALNALIRIFRRVDLMGNVAKYNTMIFQPGLICTGMS